MINGKRIGFIARCDDTGLGVESQEFVEHMKPDKILKVLVGDKPQHPERFEGKDFYGVPTEEAMIDFLTGIDILFCIETPYYRFAFSLARKMGVKTILRVNYEYLDAYTGNTRPDLYVSPVEWNLKYIPDPKIVLPFPVCTEKIKPREIRKAKTFVHIVGNGGYMDRNGTNVVLQAIQHVKSPAKFIIYAQKPIGGMEVIDARVEWRLGEGGQKKYQNLFREGDVLLYPRRHSGQSLPVNEAQAAGMAIMMTDMDPQNKFLPKELLIPVRSIHSTDIKRRIDFADIDPKAVAAKVDEWYNKDIWKFSQNSLARAEAISWKSLLPQYQKMFSNL